MKRFQNRIISSILAMTVAVAFLLTACGASSMSADMKAEAAAPQEMANGAYFDYDGYDMMEEVAVEEEMDAVTGSTGNSGSAHRCRRATARLPPPRSGPVLKNWRGNWRRGAVRPPRPNDRTATQQ